jgi:selenocysteine-specific elongation factor
MALIGTAGHVDHGKSTLVEALTGINPMHLPEEHRRELTIELGFAHLQHPDGYTIGIVDVPGHEKLVKTMISGASGFQIALWVVDAREGLMPQSLEHLDVLKLLGVPRIIPVVTKAGLATQEQIRETVQSVERLAEAPAQIVDSLSKAGIPQLLETIFDACRAMSSGNESRFQAPPYMPIDRCFVLKGVGTVVTGTLACGELKEGEPVSLSSRPGSYRIRSLHNHNAVVARITAGHRVGVHLHGLKVEDAQRGDVLVAPEYRWRSRYLNVQLTLLPGAELRWKPGLRAHFLAASFEMECRLWGLVQSDAATWVQIHLPREACFYPGQRFILRSTNPLATIGGGTVVDIAPDRPRRVTEPEQNGARYFDLSRAALFEADALTKKWMCGSNELPQGLRTASGLVWHSKLDDVTSAKLAEWVDRAKKEPAEWPFQAIAAALKIKPAHVHAYLESFLSEHFKGVMMLTSSTLRYDPRRGELSEPERRAAEELLETLRSAGLQPLRLAEYLAASRFDKKTFDKAAARLLKDGQLIRIDNEFVLERSAWDELERRVRNAGRDGFTASEFGKAFGLTRKYSVPYLECLNRTGVLQRRGDRHMVIVRRS